uniref:Uncharacterized protein n=1 Tax=Arundo donax TaxID=35708 RepID=A0A0A8Y3W0_ARUDO
MSLLTHPFSYGLACLYFTTSHLLSAPTSLLLMMLALYLILATALRHF